ncbi:MAG: hypothetical protein ABWX94_02540 [Candidatus Saccharimonadales bacterium]
MSNPEQFSSEFTTPNVLAGIRDRQSIDLHDVEKGFRAIDNALGLAPDTFEINDTATDIGSLTLYDDKSRLITHMRHVVKGPSRILPNQPVTHIGEVIQENDSTSRQWRLYLPVTGPDGQHNAQAWERYGGRVAKVQFHLATLLGALDTQLTFGQVISNDRAPKNIA